MDKGYSDDGREVALYHELAAYTLSHADKSFVHQCVVDAWAAQHADDHTRPITLCFALVGLYLHVERGFTGRQVQRVHSLLAGRRKDWPHFSVPADRGQITVRDVLHAPAGPDRDALIDQWCAAVWHAYQSTRPEIIALLHAELG